MKDLTEVIENLQHWAKNMYINTKQGDLADIIKDMQQIITKSEQEQQAETSKANLNIADVRLSLLEEEKREPIENALYATVQMTIDQSTDLAEGILTYIKDHGYDIVKINEA